MADTTLVVTEIGRAGIVDIAADADAKATTTAAGSDYYFPNDGKTVLLVVNGAVGADTYAFVAINDKYGRTETLARTVLVSDSAIIGPFLPDLWNDAAGRVKFNLGAGQATNFVLAARVANPS